MVTRLVCPGCSRVLRVDEDGRETEWVECPRCHLAMKVPLARETTYVDYRDPAAVRQKQRSRTNRNRLLVRLGLVLVLAVACALVVPMAAQRVADARQAQSLKK